MIHTAPTCIHCGSRLRQWLVPEGSSWPSEHLWVCFNDDCSYFRDGWTWMREQYSQNVSYRYAWEPATGAATMIPVWSASATRDRIVKDGAEVAA